MAFSGLLSAALAAVALAPQQAPTPWQQGVSYRIEARLDEQADVLDGRARVWYRNESPDTLREFYLHLYLNAFRPNSEWARTDLEHGVRTFQDLGPEEHGFERIQQPHGGRAGRGAVVPVRARLHRGAHRRSRPRCRRGVRSRWTTTGRRAPPPWLAGRAAAGRHYDFAQWYPRVAVYDLEGWRPHPLYRQGEFYSEFATYDVTMDVAEDQVIGATGVPVTGRPRLVQGGGGGHRTPSSTSATGTGAGAAAPPCVVRDGVRVCGIRRP